MLAYFMGIGGLAAGFLIGVFYKEWKINYDKKKG